MGGMIDPLAKVAPDVEIGEGTRVWQFASVIRGSTIGNDCVIGSCAIIDASYVGQRCKIGHGAQLHPGTVIGEYVFVGPGVIFCNDAWPRVSVDGFDAKLLLDGHITTIKVENKASIGAGSVILPGIVIGRGAMIAAGSRVDKSVPAFHLHKANGDIVPLMPRKPERLRKAA